MGVAVRAALFGFVCGLVVGVSLGLQVVCR
jgi:hypothetical protein